MKNQTQLELQTKELLYKHIKAELTPLLNERIKAELTPIDTEKTYKEALDDTYEDIDVCGFLYFPAATFQAVDPMAYQEEYLDYLSIMTREEIFFEVNEKYYDRIQVQEIIDTIEAEKKENK